MCMYDKMKAKWKNAIREKSYFSYLLTALSAMFTWGLPEEVEKRYVEQYLHCGGGFAAVPPEKNELKKWLIGETPSRTGELDQFGDGLTVQGITRNGISFEGQYNEDIAICYNNTDRMPDLDMVRYADGFSQVDKAIMANVHWTILAPVLCTRDDRTTAKIEKLVDDMLDGKLKCITSEDVLDALNGGRGEGVYSVDITHPERIRNVQYQSELYDVLMRRFFNKYGLNIQNTSKHAQATTDEVHGLDAVAWVLALDMLRARQDFCEVANRIGNTNAWSCRFSDVWQAEYERFMIREKQEDQKEEQALETKPEGDADNAESVGDSGEGSAAD